jgi:hypothetical protein
VIYKRIKNLSKMEEKFCKNCGGKLEGRSNQIYCSARCKSSINNRRVSERDKNARSIERQVKANRQILMALYRLYGERELPEFVISASAIKANYNNGMSADKLTMRYLDFILRRHTNSNFTIQKVEN